MTVQRSVLIAAIFTALAAVWWFDLAQYLSLDFLQARRETLTAQFVQNPVLIAGVYLLIYVVVTALSIPGAAVMTLAGGAIFGLFWGVVLVSFASTIGATCAFLGARYVLRDAVQNRFGDRLKPINAGITRDGAFYLFTLRLVPVFPFFLINLLLGLTQMRAWTFFWVSQVGMLAGTIVYVNAGTQLAQITSLSGILSPALIGAFVLLGIFPLLARKLVDVIKARQVYHGWTRPKQFDCNLIVIGAGAAGLVTSYIAAAVKAKVTLIEREAMGGDCLNSGCVPSKALLRSAKYAHQLKKGSAFGFANVSGQADFGAVMTRVHEVIKAIEPHDSVERYTDLGVEVLQGEAFLVDPWTVAVTLADGSTQHLTARSIVIATGAAPVVPNIPGLRESAYLTSETLWSLTELPKRLVVLGGGPIGTELTQAFARLGSHVTQVEMAPRLLMKEDSEVSEAVAESLQRDGVDLRLGSRAVAVENLSDDSYLVIESNGQQERIAFDHILVAVGRQARLDTCGLQNIGVVTERTVVVDGFLRTNFPHIFACGDVAGPYQFTHTAAHMAWYAAVNSLFSPVLALRGGLFKVDYSVIPWATFCDPEVARVGLNEQDAKEQGITYEVTRYGIDDLDRAIADGSAHGFVKVLTVPGKDKILGVTIVGEHAGDLIAEFVLAMRHGLGLNKVLGTIHIYPTFAESNKYVAGAWKQAHKPEELLRWVQRWFAWRRG
ncbi:MAG: FAD-dependent oxidoreductase [Moraxellaceae bacterium]|nr:FAD-dependent oxidoreductase [Moraxellaceae bacterium]MDZ4387611.1 FAD-dependent oxidoreductase [Moraxellaceae bacterium]